MMNVKMGDVSSDRLMPPVSQPGLWHGLKMKFQELWEKVNLSSETFVRFGTYVAIGFFAGFLLKKYFNVMVFLLLSAILIVLGLEYLGIVTIDWISMRAVLGIHANVTVGAMLTSWFIWIKMHLTMVIAGMIGFIIGYKLG